jgi:hypothetical protein
MKIKETIKNKKDMKKDKIRNLNMDVKGIKLGSRELFRDLSKSTLVDTTLKKSGKDDY